MKRKKIFYVPGLISLIGLPLLAFLFIPAGKPEMVVRLYLPHDRWSSGGNYIFAFSDESFLQSIISKKIVVVDLRPLESAELGKIQNDKKLLIDDELRKMKSLRDTNTVLKVSIGKLNTYGEFVWLVNQALVHQIKRWMFEDGDFYFVNIIPAVRTPETEIPMLLL